MESYAAPFVNFVLWSTGLSLAALVLTIWWDQRVARQQRPAVSAPKAPVAHQTPLHRRGANDPHLPRAA
ncbi:hypothetical protein E4T66_20840 [Sinimarinibacterium sp. CAU 1509]|uniref:hypothetical protein n=1 Tax=Sinimarinibacterium sp. CAU 1509 TaxID=2562283 RepID=UPI0010ABC813|nr:hypothetical protein [Sinimarinibacterium sp. CAU 1509]TJY55559.1 hypothetical protein E4T66_20840 [Sinimarinibacterium sp. CAU 1509]